jgi:hypothetical protein
MTIWKQTIFGSVRWLHDVWRVDRSPTSTGLRETADG